MVQVSEGSVDRVIKINRTVSEFNHHFSKHYFLNFLKGKDFVALIAQKDGQDAGFAICYADKINSWVVGWVLAVDPKYRRMGIASKLVEEEQKWTKIKGYRRIKTDISSGRPDAIRLVLGMGYLIVGVELNADIDNTRVFLEKRW